MRTVSLRLADLERSTIPIGFQDENEHTQVRIDCKMFFKDYPTAVPSLAVTPPKGSPYPAIVVRDGDIVTWDVTASDTAAEGTGELQLTFTISTEVAKSYVGKTRVSRSIMPSGTAPTPIQNWINVANVVLDEVAHAVETAIHPPVIDDNGYWNVWDAENDEYVATEYKAEGQDGAPGTDGHDGSDGFSPTATVTKSGKVATISITDKNGTTTETVEDGADADPTVLIDDTAGSGDTNKVWSADKSSTLLTEINAVKDDPIPSAVKTALLALAENVAYATNQGQSVYNALAGALYNEVWPVTNTLSHCTSSNSSQSVTKNGSYSATITADTDYTLTGATVVITMGGVDITSTAYSNGTISIASVTGVLSISIEAATESAGYVTDGLTAYWDGIDNTGTDHDGNATTWVDKANGYTLEMGTFGNSSYMTWGQNCLEFAGDYRQGLHLDSYWQFSQSATVEVVFVTDATSTQMIATLDRGDTAYGSTYDARRVSIFGDNTVGIRGNSSKSYTNTESAVTAIRKVAILYNGFDASKVLINNTETSQGNNNHSFGFTGTKQLRIGRECEAQTQGSGYPFDGKIYAIRVYSRHLTAEEMSQNYSYDMDRFGLE